MKLRNKKTGEIRDGEDVILENLRKNGTTLNAINIEEIKEEWEDYEEPKSYYYITSIGEIVFRGFRLKKWNGGDDRRKQIGNHFETQEEAEKADEKLKAWKRLKDKGFRFDGYDVAHNSHNIICGQAYFKAGDYYVKDVEKDLDLLFGGGVIENYRNNNCDTASRNLA